MNKNVFEGKWKQMRGQVKEWWGNLTDGELDRAAGKAEKVVGLLQAKYGYTRAHAAEEYDRRMKEAGAYATETHKAEAHMAAAHKAEETMAEAHQAEARAARVHEAEIHEAEVHAAKAHKAGVD
jgi:uncharacterized protein YjbJ (UPF0337 family)